MADPPQDFRATYNSINNPAFSHTAVIPPLISNTTSGRIDFLSSLRKEITILQRRINAELTKRMEDDKAQQASGLATSGKNRIVDEIAEEEKYGEDGTEED